MSSIQTDAARPRDEGTQLVGYKEIQNSHPGLEHTSSKIQSEDLSYIIEVPDRTYSDTFKLSTDAEIEFEIHRMKALKQKQMRLMYFLSTNTSYYGMSTIVNFAYLTISLKRSIQEISLLAALISLVRSFKPLFGIIVDTKHFRGLQFSPYIICCAGIHFICCIIVFLKAPSFGFLCMVEVVVAVCLGFLDVIGEGLVALNTQLEYQIIDLEIILEKRARVAESDQEVENKNSKEEAPAKSVNDLEIIGYFSILKGLFENIMTIVGGVLSETISIQTSYLILSLYPILVLVYLFFFFREEKSLLKQDAWESAKKGSKELLKLCLKPEFGLPWLYYFLSVIFPPSFFDFMQFIHVKKLQFDISTISTIDSIASMCHLLTGVWLIHSLKGLPLWKLFVFANFAKLIRVTAFAPFYNFSPGTLKFIRFIYTFAEGFSVEFCMIALVGYLTKKIPKGMESTGIVVILSSLNLAFGLSDSYGVRLLNSYKVKDGFYERGADMLLYGYIQTVLMNLISPLFLIIWKQYNFTSQQRKINQ